MLVGSSIVTTMLIPASSLRRAARLRTRARVSGARAPRRGLRHGLRHQHGRDPVVRRRIGDGRPAEPGAEVSAPLRHGARVGQGAPAAGRDLHRGHLPRDDPLQGRRERPGGRLRDRRAGADGICRPRRHACRLAGRPLVDRLHVPDGGVRLHHHRQHRRTARRDQDRFHLHRRDCHQLARVTGPSLDRAADPGGGT